MRAKRPEFPITVSSLARGENYTFADAAELVTKLERFDSADPHEEAIVLDKSGRKVRLKVEKLQLEIFELELFDSTNSWELA